MPGPSNSSNRFGPSSYVVGTPANGLGNGVNFTSIQAAVNQAVADGFGPANPVDVIIRAGIYTEDVTITDGGIGLVGVSDAPFNLLGQHTFINGTISLVITGLNQFALSNLFVRGVLGSALTVTGAGVPCRLSASNCTFSSLAAAMPGVSFTNASGTFGTANFSRCSLTSALAEAHFSSARTISALVNCNLRGATNMITLDVSARVQLLYSVGSATAGFGVQFLSSANQVANCEFTTITSSDSTVDMTPGGVSQIKHCTFTSNAASGFFITGTGNLNYTDVVNVGSAIDLDPALGITTVNDWKPYAQVGAGPAPSLGTVRGTSCFDSGTFAVTDGFVELVGGPAASTFPVDNGGPGVPLAGAMSLLGSTSVDFPNPSGIETHVGATTNQIYLEDRRWTSSLIVDPDATVGLRGTFTTITAALAAAVALQTIYVRPGIYTESFVLKDFVNIIGLTTPSGGINGIASVGNLIDGTITTDASSGSSTIQNLRINTAVGPSIVVTDGAIVNIVGCTVQSTTICLQMIDGTAFIDSCYVSGGVNAVEYDTNSGPTVRASNSRLDSVSSAVKIDTSSTFFAKNCQFVNQGGNCLEATVLGINVEFTNCQLISNGTNAIDVSGGGSLSVNFCEVNAPAASAIELGAGGCAVRSFHNTYNSGGPNYITGTVGTYDFANDVINPITSANIDPGITVTTYGWRPWATVAGSPGTNSDKGNASFDSAQFTSTDGFIQLSGGNSPVFTDVSGVLSAVRNNGYYATAATTFTLDSLALQGDLVIIYADTAAAVVVTCNVGQFIRLGSTLTVAAGTATSTAIGDSLTLRYRAATLTWEVVSSMGNFILV